MDPLPDSSIASLQAARLQQFVSSLSAIRTADRSDARIICNGKEFFIHKWVLESASPYFTTMFSSGLEEAETGKITFNRMEAETMEIILDYIYSGRVENIVTDEQLKNVLMASHLLQLEPLFEYCCTSMSNRLTFENFFDAFHISEKYETGVLREKIKKYWITNSAELLTSGNLSLLSLSEMETMINHLKCSRLCLDPVVEGIVMWVLHDVRKREVFAGKLLKSVNVQLLSREYVTSLLKNQAAIPSSDVISSELKELCMASFLSGSDASPTIASFPEKIMQLWATLSYFSSNMTFKVFDEPPPNCDEVPVVGKSVVQCNCMQQFDLRTMTWLPMHDLNLKDYYVRFHDRFCQYKHQIYLFTAHDASENGVYNMLDHTITQNCPPNSTIPGACTVCYFEGFFYAFGGAPANSSVRFISPGGKEWLTTKSLPVGVGEYPTVLTSSDDIYVIAENISEPEEQLIIQYGFGSIKDFDWKVIGICSKGLKPSHFFISDNVLNAMHFSESMCKQLVFSKENQKFMVKRKFNWPAKESLRVSEFQNSMFPYVFFSKIDDHFGIPYMQLKLETGIWKKLPAPRGECHIPNTQELEPIYSFQQ